jgi:hypothetical protein
MKRGRRGQVKNMLAVNTLPLHPFFFESKNKKVPRDKEKKAIAWKLHMTYYAQEVDDHQDDDNDAGDNPERKTRPFGQPERDDKRGCRQLSWDCQEPVN